MQIEEAHKMKTADPIADANRSFTRLTPVVQKRLQDEWLPRLDKMVENRRPMRRLLSGILIVALLLVGFVVVLVAIQMVYPNTEEGFNVRTGTLLGISGSITALVFVWLGKLQSCDDAIEGIGMAVYLGVLEPLLDAIKEVNCYARFKGIIDDVKRIFP